MKIYINKINTKNLIVFISYFIILDILFFPYFQYFIIPYSLPVVLITLIFLNNFKKSLYWKLFIIIGCSMIISVFISIFLNLEIIYIIDNLKRLIQLLSTFSYFFFFYNITKKYALNYKKIFYIFILTQLLLSISFFFNPDILLYLHNNIYLTKSSANPDRLLFFMRYPYIFTDPNTGAYFTLIIILYLLEREKRFILKCFLFIVSVFLLFSFKSNGAFLSFFISIILLLIKQKKYIFKVKHLITILFIIILVIFSFYKFDFNFFGRLVDSYLKRANYNVMENPRVSIYIKAIKNFYPFLFGRGYNLLINNNFFKPHSDHLRLIYSYGFISYFSMLIFMFKNLFKDNFIFLIPSFVAFSINTLIDEQKLFGLTMILLGISVTRITKNKIKNTRGGI